MKVNVKTRRAPAGAARSKPSPRRRSAGAAENHIHLPSVHLRSADGTGYDYQEDYYIHGVRIERVVSFVLLESGRPTLGRVTRDWLCQEDAAGLMEELPILMDEGHPAAKAAMEECARREFERQVRIAAGSEIACRSCGCSETRSCSGGCCWATMTLCSRCV